MFSKTTLLKAINATVFDKKVDNGIWFIVNTYNKERHTYNVKYKDIEGKMKDKFTCDCYHYSNKTLHGGTICCHIIASIIYMAKQKWIDKRWLNFIFEKEVGNLSRPALRQLVK